MVVIIPAQSEQQYDALLELIYNQKSAYLEPVLDLIELTWEQFGHYFRRTGTAFCIYQAGKLIGLCWIKCENRLLKLQGLIIHPEAQGQGVGSQALRWLEETFANDIFAIELDVHEGNPRAKSLYQRMGYQVKAYSPSTGFYTLRKPLVKLTRRWKARLPQIAPARIV